jgi:hypothetical protein
LPVDDDPDLPVFTGDACESAARCFLVGAGYVAPHSSCEYIVHGTRERFLPWSTSPATESRNEVMPQNGSLFDTRTSHEDCTITPEVLMCRVAASFMPSSCVFFGDRLLYDDGDVSIDACHVYPVCQSPVSSWCGLCARPEGYGAEMSRRPVNTCVVPGMPVVAGSSHDAHAALEVVVPCHGGMPTGRQNDIIPTSTWAAE